MLKKYFVIIFCFLGIIFYRQIRAEEVIAHTMRCVDGIVLILGTKEAIIKTKEITKNLSDISTFELIKKIKEEKIEGIEEIEEYKEEKQSVEKKVKILSLTIREAEEQEFIPFIENLSLSEAEDFLRKIGFTCLVKSTEIAGFKTPVDIIVKSDGTWTWVESDGSWKGGIFTKIIVNGRNLPVEGRGYTLVIINENTGDVEKVANFDTYFKENSILLAKFIEEIPFGKIVLAAVRDEAFKSLNQEAVFALKKIGSKIDLRNCWRCSHALIGIKGLKEGEALEKSSFSLSEVEARKGIEDDCDENLIKIFKEKGNIIYFLEGVKAGDKIKIVKGE